MKFAYTRPDGNVTVSFGVPKDQLSFTLCRLLTDEEYEQFLRKELIPPWATDAIRLPDTWPTDDENDFFNALVRKGEGLSFDMAKARNIWRDKMRQARIDIFAKLDLDYLRADEDGDAALKAEIVRKKRALRDVTDDPAIEAASTISELRQVWPDILK